MTDASYPKLVALTPEAEQAAGRVEIALSHFPFRIGRESRVMIVNGEFTLAERRKAGTDQPTNDLYLIDRGRPLNISRQHFMINYDTEDEEYHLIDRGSACGTQVQGVAVGGYDSGGAIVLQPGDSIVVGMPDSPYVFRFVESASPCEDSLADD